MAKDKPARTPYPSDLADAPWTILAPMIPTAYTQRGGRPREVDMRAVMNAPVSLHRSGCQGEMLPHELLPKSTVYAYLARWRDEGTWAKMLRAWRVHTRRQAGREPTPRAACIDSQSLNTTGLSAAMMAASR